MDENDPARLEAFIHVVDGQQRVAHVLERVDRERDIESPGQIKLLAGRANELQFDPFASTKFEDPFLQIGEEIEFRPQWFDGCDVQSLARQIGRQDAGSSSNLEDFD